MRDKASKTNPKLRPAERLSREQGTITKDWGGRLPIALIYPNSYYLGMSNLGLHTVYGLLNSYKEVVCERVFWKPERKLPVSVESQRPLSDFAVIAFSVSYELDYFNVVQVLKTSGLPLYAADRDERHPLIIAGGPCITANPMPMALFFDCLCIGEAEPIIPVMLPVLIEGIGGQRSELLKVLSVLPGLFVPQYHSGTPVVRQWTRDLDEFPVASVVLTPDTELGDMYLMEVERGCNWGCRFCLVGTIFRPMRVHAVDRLVEQAERGLDYRKRLGLVGPAVTDHPQIEEFLSQLRGLGAELAISSLRIGSLSRRVLSELAKGGVRTITLAPEAGSERLRGVIKKGISNEDILETMGKAAEHGMKQLKLYFMIGLPSETDEDIEEIVRLTLAGKSIIERQKSGTRLTLNIAPFVPKASTPFQWLPMAPVPLLNRRMTMLKTYLSPKGITPKCESPAWSQVQTVLARGDKGVAEVLANIDEVSLSGWRKAAAKCHLDIDFYTHQRWGLEQKLPWVVIDSGTEEEKLKSELDRASQIIL